MTLQPAPPSGTHWLGTDTFGRGVFSMMLAGAWPTFIVGIGAAVVSATLGSLMAVASAVFRGGTDRLLSKISDVLLLFPALHRRGAGVRRQGLVSGVAPSGAHMIPLAAATVLTSVVAHGFASWLAHSYELTNWGALMFIAVSSPVSRDCSNGTSSPPVQWPCRSSPRGFYLVSLGLKDAAFRGSDRHRSRRVRAARSYSGI